jgi:sec-independent protein translocase protein TatA
MDPIELVIIGIVVVVFIVLGPKKIPELARALGSAKKEFNAGAQSGGSMAPTAGATTPMGEDDLMVAARKLGISTEGKTREQISAEIVRKTAGT